MDQASGRQSWQEPSLVLSNRRPPPTMSGGGVKEEY